MTDDHIPTKRCAKCGEHKPITLFSKNKQHPDGFQTRCKACVKLENQAYRQKNGDVWRERQRARYHQNVEEELERCRAYRTVNAETIRQRRREYCMNHPDIIRERNRKYRTANIEAVREKHQAYRTANADVIAKRCLGCGEIKLLTNFTKDESRKDGYKARCKECRSLEGQAYRQANADVIREYKRNYYEVNVDVISKKKRLNRQNNPDVDRAARARRRALIRNNGGTFTAEELIAMRAASNGICAYCRRQLDPQVLTIDHVIPLHQGGRHEAANIVLACGKCNRSKGARTPDQWEKRWYY